MTTTPPEPSNQGSAPEPAASPPAHAAPPAVPTPPAASPPAPAAPPAAAPPAAAPPAVPTPPAALTPAALTPVNPQWTTTPPQGPAAEPVQPPSVAPQPTCPRHPTTITHIRCQRCELPVCVECQRPAAVGFHCVSCVQDAAAAHPGQRTVFGGQLMSEKPVVTWSMMAICGVVYLLQLLTQGRGAGSFTEQMFFVPVLGETQPWRFLTGAFAHSLGSMMHIASNMIALWFFGREVERLFGQKLFAAIYLLSALGGNVMVLLLAHPPQSQLDMATTAWLTPVLGASGAVFGLFGAAMVCAREQRMPLGGFVALFAINAAMPLVIPNISWQGHVGGLLVGLAVTAGLLAMRKAGKPQLQWGVVGLSVALLVLVVMLKYGMADQSFLYMLYGPAGGI